MHLFWSTYSLVGLEEFSNAARPNRHMVPEDGKHNHNDRMTCDLAPAAIGPRARGFIRGLGATECLAAGMCRTHSLDGAASCGACR